MWCQALICQSCVQDMQHNVILRNNLPFMYTGSVTESKYILWCPNLSILYTESPIKCDVMSPLSLTMMSSPICHSFIQNLSTKMMSGKSTVKCLTSKILMFNFFNLKLFRYKIFRLWSLPTCACPTVRIFMRSQETNIIYFYLSSVKVLNTIK